MRRSNLFRATLMCAAGAALLAGASPAAAGYASSVIVTGLNNPRGLAFDSTGALFVAEAGFLAADGPTVDIRGAPSRYGETGSITRYFGGSQQRVVTGLSSLTSVATGETIGAQDIAFGGDGTGYVVIGLGTDPAARAGALGSAPGALNLAGIRTFSGSATTAFADVGAFETANNPAGGPFDSNPFHLVTTAGGGLLVTDAGANTLLNVGPSGALSLAAVFPGRDIGGGFPSDAVPTGVTIGPDGAYYVGQLTGFPFTPGSAQVYRIAPGEATTVFETGFTNITDLQFGADGSLYVLELDADSLLGPGTNGALIRVGTDGTRSTISSALTAPTGFTIGTDGAFYVTNFSTSAGTGQVVRIAAVPEPAAWALMIGGFGMVGAAMRRRAISAA